MINERLDIVECLVKESEYRAILAKDSLPRVPDLLFLSKKLSTKKAKLQDCYHVYQAVASVSSVVSVLRKLENKCVSSSLVGPICDSLNDLDKYQSMIEQVLDMDLVERGEFLVKSSFNDELSGTNKFY